MFYKYYMTKYIGSVNIDFENYYFSAYQVNSANSAMLVASSYTTDEPVYLFDNFVGIYLDHPYKYSENAVTSLLPSAVDMLNTTSSVETSLNVYDEHLNVVTTAYAKFNILPTFHGGLNNHNNAHYTETVEGVFTQTATYTEQTTATEWIVPITFKVASYYDMSMFYSTYDVNNNATGYLVDDPSVTRTYTVTFGGSKYTLERKHYWGTTIPAMLFNEANLANIPVYAADDTSYRLNTQVVAGYGNNGHIDDVSANDFVKFMQSLQNLANCEIISGTVKKNTYDASALILSSVANIDYESNVKQHAILTANIDEVKCGVLQDDIVNFAFYDANGNYKSLTANDNTIYDEYTYYCRMPVTAYPNSGAAINAIQQLIDSYQYNWANSVDVDAMYGLVGTLKQSADVFTTHDYMFGNTWNANKYYLYSSPHGASFICEPVALLDSHSRLEAYITAVRVDNLYKYRDISTVITKPVVVSSDVKQITESTYTYEFDNLYILNSSAHSFETLDNDLLAKAAMFNTIEYSPAQLAPVEKSVATYFPYAGIASEYYNAYYNNYKHTSLPVSTAISVRNRDLLNIAIATYAKSDVLYPTMPTRTIHYCITMSK